MQAAQARLKAAEERARAAEKQLEAQQTQAVTGEEAKPEPAPEVVPVEEAVEPPPVQLLPPPSAQVPGEEPVAVPVVPVPAPEVPVLAEPQASAEPAGPVVPAGGGESPSSRPMDPSAYTLGPGDAVQIYLRGIPEADRVEDIIDEAGMVTLPFINEIRAAGLTASQLERTIRDTYLKQGIYRNMTVQVIVPTRFYYISGTIRGPGRYNLQNAVHVSEAIAAAGGGTEFWNGKVLIRRNGAIFKIIKNAKKLERTPEDDILLEPGDIVELQERFF